MPPLPLGLEQPAQLLHRFADVDKKTLGAERHTIPPSIPKPKANMRTGDPALIDEGKKRRKQLTGQ
jgi:hypothetical protein